MENINNEEIKEVPSTSTENKEEVVEDTTPEAQPPQDPVKKELENIEKGKKTYTKRERLNFEKGKIDEQIKVLDEEDGIPIEVTDETPVTVGMLKKQEKEQSQKTALNLAEAIEDEDERKLTIHYLENRIKPSGNAEEDVKTARAIVNSVRNGQIATEIDRKKTPKHISSPAGAPPTHEKAFTPTDAERVFMQPPYKMTKDDILKARAETQNNQ